MPHFAYFRTSSKEQSVESQRSAMGGTYDAEFVDHGVSGGVMAAQRSQFAALMRKIRAGDTLHVYAVDRLGRDAIDVQQTVQTLAAMEQRVRGEVVARGVSINVHGLGIIGGDGAGRIVLAVLAQVAEMEKARIRDRTEAGRVAARESLAKTGKTHKGKASMGRPLGTAKDGVTVDPAALLRWKGKTGASIAKTAAHWKVSESSVKRYCRAAAAA